MNYPLSKLRMVGLECLVARRSYSLKADTIIRKLTRRHRWCHRSDWDRIVGEEK